MNTTKPPLINEISNFISDGLPVVFDTMLSTPATPVAATDYHASDQETVVGSVGFIGDANGVVYIHFAGTLATTLASRMLGMPEAELDAEMVNDVIGELSNMVVGSVKSHLCDSGAPCVLTIPSIVRGKNFSIDSVSTAERSVLCFACGASQVLVELLMKQPALGEK